MHRAEGEGAARRARIAGVVAFLGAILLVDSGCGPRRCAAGDTCECPTTGTCDLTCAGKGCKFTMNGAGTAHFSCKEGGCSVDVQGSVNATVDCEGGRCKVSSMGSGDTLVRCPGGKCTLGCLGGGKCQIKECDDCSTGPSNAAAPVPADWSKTSDGRKWGAAKGTLTVTKNDKTVATLAVDQCWSGQMLSFRGVEFFQEPTPARRVRIVEHPVEGTRAVLIGFFPAKDRIVLDAKSCKTLSATIKGTNNRLNRVEGIKGSVSLDCDVPEGHVTANVTLEQCAFDNRAKGL